MTLDRVTLVGVEMVFSGPVRVGTVVVVDMTINEADFKDIAAVVKEVAVKAG